MPKKKLPDHVQDRKGVWRFYGIGFTVLHYGAGVVAIGISLVVSSAPIWTSKSHPISRGVAIVISAFFTGVATFLTARERADAFWAAWKRLDAATRRFQNGNAALEDLERAIDEGEKLIESEKLLTNETKLLKRETKRVKKGP